MVGSGRMEYYFGTGHKTDYSKCWSDYRKPDYQRKNTIYDFSKLSITITRFDR